MRSVSMLAILALTLCTWPGIAWTADTYTGSKACADCHAAEYERFMTHSKKAASFKSIQIMSGKLTKQEIEECYGCHTTGYGKPGGFVSPEKTPDLMNAGCEVCHGPGSAHVASGGDPSLIKRKLVIEDCSTCHNAQRVRSFGFKPILHAGAH